MKKQTENAKTNSKSQLKIKSNLNSETKIILERNIKQEKKTEKILNDKNILVPDEYKKQFLDFDIKIDSSKKTNTSCNTNSTVTKGDNVLQNLNKINTIVAECSMKIEKLKNEFLNNENPNENITLLKNELINLKTKIEFYKLKSEFYENIFFTTKNYIENINVSQVGELNLFKSEIKSKLNLIFTQNNKFYYENLNRNFFVSDKNINFGANNFENYNSNTKVVQNLENSLSSLLVDINKFLSNNSLSINSTQLSILNLRENILMNMKTILSLYILNDNYNINFKSKNSFFLENENNYIELEKKDRMSKIVKDFDNFTNPFMNRAMNNKFKLDLLEKVKTLVNFYENFNVILKTENISIKNNTEVYVNSTNVKINLIQKLCENFIIYSEPNFQKMNELLGLLENKSIKNIEKVLFSYIKNEQLSFVDLIEKYKEFNKNYYLSR